VVGLNKMQNLSFIQKYVGKISRIFKFQQLHAVLSIPFGVKHDWKAPKIFQDTRHALI
jgi:hypothetical protein